MSTKELKKADPSSWEFLRTATMTVHNEWVDQEFKRWSILNNAPAFQGELKTACKINPKDSAILCIFRFWLFYCFVKNTGTIGALNEPIPSEHQLKLNKVNQLRIFYQPVGKDRGLYTLTIPHWNKSPEITKQVNFPAINKGKWSAIVVLWDNSKIVINAKTKTECESLYKWCISHVKRPMSRNHTVTYYQRDKGKEVKVTATKIKFYDKFKGMLYEAWV